MYWSSYAATVRVAAQNAGRVRRAFKSVLHGDEIARQWAESHPAGGSVSPQLARDWARTQISVSKKPMQLALARLYAEGYVTGEFAAEGRLARLIGLRKALVACIAKCKATVGQYHVDRVNVIGCIKCW
jgi:hypothetical protein